MNLLANQPIKKNPPQGTYVPRESNKFLVCGLKVRLEDVAKIVSKLSCLVNTSQAWYTSGM